MNDWMYEWYVYINACRESIWIERKRFTMNTAIVTNDQNGTKHTRKISTKTIAKNDRTQQVFNPMARTRTRNTQGDR